MRQLALTAAMQAFAAIDLRDAIYVACAVSSGRREIELMTEMSLFDRDELRGQYVERWRRDVLEPNKVAADVAVLAARVRHAGRSVINPSEFDLHGLTQPDYDSLCGDIIRCHVGRLVLAEGWQFSRGARLEAVQALDLGLSVEDGHGNSLGKEQILGAMGEVEPALVRRGVPHDVVRKLLPEVSPVP